MLEHKQSDAGEMTQRYIIKRMCNIIMLCETTWSIVKEWRFYCTGVWWCVSSAAAGSKRAQVCLAFIADSHFFQDFTNTIMTHTILYTLYGIFSNNCNTLTSSTSNNNNNNNNNVSRRTGLAAGWSACFPEVLCHCQKTRIKWRNKGVQPRELPAAVILLRASLCAFFRSVVTQQVSRAS